MERDYVSIILPTYNRAAKITASIQSVLDQTYPYFELLVIDDGSSDETETVVKSLKDERIRYHRLSENSGASAARNEGMRLARYEYLAFQDSDDRWRKEKLEKQICAIKSASRGTGFVYHKTRYDMGGGAFCIIPDENIPVDKKDGHIWEQLLWDNLVDMPTLFMKRSCYETVGEMDTSFLALEDYDYVLRLSKRYEAVFLDEVLLDAEFSTSGVSGNPANYLMASCLLIQKHKQDYMTSGALEHRMEIILRDAKRLGVLEQTAGLLEKILRSG